MKSTFLVIIAVLFSGVVWGQIKVDTKNKKITINAKGVDSADVVLDKKGEYTLYLEGLRSYSIQKRAKSYDPLKISNFTEKVLNKLDGKNDADTLPLRFRSNTEYIITAATDSTVPQKRKFILQRESDWSWTTTLGANAVFLRNRSKFVSKEKDGVYSVAEIKDSKSMELMPAIMFTLMNNQNNLSPGFTGGIGFNFEELTVFTGGSLGIGQNIVLTGGVAVHRQSRPNPEYSIGQVIASSVTTENLNQQQYRVNPFIGISFRFDKNPFKKAETE